MLVAIGQQRQKARALDSGVELALKNRACAGQTGGDDLPVFRDEIAQGVDVLVVDLFHTGNGEAAKALALEQQRLGIALGTLVFVELLERGQKASENKSCEKSCICKTTDLPALELLR